MTDNWKAITHDAFTHLAKLVEKFFTNHANELNAIEWKSLGDPENDFNNIDSYWLNTILSIYKELHIAKLQDELRFFNNEFDAFFRQVIKENFGNDYRPHFNVGREISIEKFESLEKDEKEWYIEIEPFLWQKKRLYERLHDYQQQIEERETKKTVTEIKSTPIPASIQDYFVERNDWEKYIDALCMTEPPILRGKYEFLAKRGHKGVLGGWIMYLKDKCIIADLPRQVLAVVFNKHIQKLQLGDDGKSISRGQELFDNNFKAQLKKLTGIS